MKEAPVTRSWKRVPANGSATGFGGGSETKTPSVGLKKTVLSVFTKKKGREKRRLHEEG